MGFFGTLLSSDTPAVEHSPVRPGAPRCEAAIGSRRPPVDRCGAWPDAAGGSHALFGVIAADTGKNAFEVLNREMRRALSNIPASSFDRGNPDKSLENPFLHQTDSGAYN